MEKDQIEKLLFVSASDNYGDKYIEHLLEQYKIYINATEKISDRRQKSNEFFLALNAALVTLLGYLTTKSNHNQAEVMILFASIAGITICYLWYRIIHAYKGLNSGKFKVIHSIEARLPLALYDTEWELLGRGKHKELYWPFTHIEIKVPWIFMIIYSLLILSVIPWMKLSHAFCNVIY